MIRKILGFVLMSWWAWAMLGASLYFNGIVGTTQILTLLMVCMVGGFIVFLSLYHGERLMKRKPDDGSTV